VARVTAWATTQQIPVDKVVTEVGSALNGHRRKFLALLGDPSVVRIVVEHRDRYHNLLAHPDTHIAIGADRRAVTAVQADKDERARLWPRLVAAYADFDSYQSWTTREIPVMVLRPR
jgi:deazaflavin-dependent oxidoreductase (nitroreductase family)